jgi:glyoxylase-like metal-dependent hydrolase (beta-lactamase superfamily II)
MEKLYDDLWQTKLAIPFGGVKTHAYFLQSDNGNVLFYNTSHNDEIQQMAELGGIKYQYLSHRDESGDSLQIIRERFNSQLCCHKNEEHIISQSCTVDVIFSDRTTHFSDIEAIPTPGHTNGSLSFLDHSPYGRTYLFTGDTLFRSNEH